MRFITLTQISKDGIEEKVTFNTNFIKTMKPAVIGGGTQVYLAVELDGFRLVKEKMADIITISKIGCNCK